MKIAVLSRNPNLYSTRRLKEAIEAKGHEAQIIDHLKCDIVMDDEGPLNFLSRQIVERYQCHHSKNRCISYFFMELR